MLQVRVTRKTMDATDIAVLELASVDEARHPLPAFSAGSHIDVHLPNGLVRQYSLCNSPADSHRYQIGVLRDSASRGGSAAVHDLLMEEATLEISSPRNHFPLAVDASHSILLAGGIGVTPILCMAERLSATDASFEFHYCTRSLDRTAFHSRILASAFAARVSFHHDDGDEDQKIRLRELLEARRDATGVHLYVCGPQGFLDWVIQSAQAVAWPAAQLHYEYFGAEVSKSNGDAEFEVQISSSGLLVRVPGGQSVVEALAQHGVQVETSCEQGVCGTCVTRVLRGTPDHRDHYLTAQEHAANDQFMPCCSRSRSPVLVLDL
ncbi:PDR/VanB family oxidoreductase [Variovorax sp. J22P168]|uniref:PDR/VanB family oxidoreductase n=1 Tax=Variovorax jilinensis TaxID=3053513 RepID=UPI0025779632|nr:PDR/VanB family oxidoreductase [Variovorax sp. J22P168]MDM0012082.1 PDR/VanB family oxidoreductase [Variovorax sp. J22P168]